MRWFGFYVITIAIAVLLASCLQSNEVDLEQEQSSKDKKESSDISTNSSSHTYSSSFQIFKPSSADWIESSSSENQPTSSSSAEPVSSATPVPQWREYTHILYRAGLGLSISYGGWWYRRMKIEENDTAKVLCPTASNDTLVSSSLSTTGYYPVDIECETALGMTFEFQIPDGFPLESTAAGFECVEFFRDSLGNPLDTTVQFDDYCNYVLGRTLVIDYNASDSTIMRLVSGSQHGEFAYLVLPPGKYPYYNVDFDSLRYSETDSIIGQEFWRTHIITGVEFTGKTDGSTLSILEVGQAWAY